ncbi:hypothetical protein M9H77_23443 [Catharanthus roseus]|uniref:Uncharacterized protein n=1 Tax=Catharanthus roseus TaxID=4058 RepID=A0ACC0ATD1_CATRO|nr:hypothetical protein M9H77_23443 [Catharanthus roseus]
MANPFTCEVPLVVAHMRKCSSLCPYLEKQLLDSVARIKLSYHGLRLLHDNLFFSSYFLLMSYLLMNLCGWLYCSLCDNLHVKYMGMYVKECGYFPSFLDNFVKNHEAFTLLNQFLLYVGDHIQIPCDEYEPLIVDETLKTLLLGKFHGFCYAMEIW